MGTSLWLAILLAAAVPAAAYHDPATDCFAYFDGEGIGGPGDATIACTDGDPTCDADGAANGSCAFDVRICVTYRDLAECRPRKVHTLRAHPSRYHVTPPRLPASRGACSETTRVVVPLKAHGRRPGRARIVMLARAKGPSPRTDRDRLDYRCLPAACEGSPAGAFPCSQTEREP
ncbi:MAG TPA: hypothetical protein VMS22_04710 [Candidatus Eisenbacteria bacterium]|nr:hypothetical protein [Candidatus Eisenbacteria bacterium]